MSRISSLEVQLSNVKSLLRTMCDAVNTGLVTLIQHFEHPNPNRLIKIVVLDSEIDNLERAIDTSILQILATQQPLGYELRLAYACAKIAHHIERIGDAVESLARQLVNGDIPDQKEIFLEMLNDSKDLFERSYTAMFEGDLSLIQEIHLLDDKVDFKQRELYHIAKKILKKESKGNIDKALRIISMSAKIEKIADLCCNWAEQIDLAENGMFVEKFKKENIVWFLWIMLVVLLLVLQLLFCTKVLKILSICLLLQVSQLKQITYLILQIYFLSMKLLRKFFLLLELRP